MDRHLGGILSSVILSEAKDLVANLGVTVTEVACTLCFDFLQEHQLHDIKDQNETCFYVEFPHDVLEGWGMILPKRHCETVFDLTEEEVSDTFRLLNRAQLRLQEQLGPEGYSIGWNCYKVGGQTTPHAHLHVMPRFADEPLAGMGIRHWFKKRENLRPHRT